MVYCDKEFIGNKLREYRKKLKLTQEEVAIKAGIDEKHYGKLERGIFLPGIDTFFKLIEILNIPLGDFGVKAISSANNEKKEALLRQIYSSKDSEIEAFLEIIKVIKKLK